MPTTHTSPSPVLPDVDDDPAAPPHSNNADVDADTDIETYVDETDNELPASTASSDRKGATSTSRRIHNGSAFRIPLQIPSLKSFKLKEHRFCPPPFRIRLALPLYTPNPKPIVTRITDFTYSLRDWPRRYLPRSNAARMFLLLTLLLLGSLCAYIYTTEAALSAPWSPDVGALLFAQRPLVSQPDDTFLTGGSDSAYTLPLRTKGRNVVDQRGRRFKLASINWYGASDELFVPGGLEVQHRSVIAQTIRGLGFNSVRLPYSDEMVMTNPVILPHLLVANPDLVGLRALDVFEAVVAALTDAGIAVIINNHITSAQWCCGADPCDAGWANDHLGPLCRVRQTEDEWIEHWETVMERFVDNPLVIGADLRNEVRGLWGTMPWEKWADAAERAGNALLKIKSDWLIVVGGTESNNDLTGVGRRPIKLDVENRVVYSAHVYSWSGWGSPEGRYCTRAYPSFVRAMRRNWAYILESNDAPVWIGEFGAPHIASKGDANYWQNLLRYLKSIDADFGYWAINPRKAHDDAKESYSLVEDDWVTPVLDYRMRDMVELMGSS